MSAYILSMTLASLAAAIAELLAPRGGDGRLAGYVRMVAGLFLLVALTGPIRAGVDFLASTADGTLTDKILDALPENRPTDYEAVFADSLTAMSGREVETWAASVLTEHFDIPADDFYLSALCVAADEGEGTATTPIRLAELRIALFGDSALRDPHPIETYFEETLGGRCYVTVGGDASE